MPTNTVQDRTLLAALRNGKQAVIQWLDTTVPVGVAGQFTEINLTGFTISVSGNRLNITSSGGGGSQAGIQFQDEGVNLGTSGTVDTLDFVGSAVVATRVGNKVTVTVTSSGVQTINSIAPAVGGNFDITSTDGSVTITPGTNSIDLAVTVTGKTISTGAVWTVGNAGGPSLIATQFDVGMVPAAYTVTGWRLEMDRAGAFSVEVQNAAAGSLSYATMSGTSLSTGGVPNITSGQIATSSDVSLWSSTAIAIGDSIRLIIHVNTAAPAWFSLMLLVTRTL